MSAVRNVLRADMDLAVVTPVLARMERPVTHSVDAAHVREDSMGNTVN